MAHPIGFPQANCILARPPDMAEEECASLEVFRNGEVCVSKWQLTDEELEALRKNGGKVFVLVWGATQPPVAITPINPFGN